MWRLIKFLQSKTRNILRSSNSHPTSETSFVFYWHRPKFIFWAEVIGYAINLDPKFHFWLRSNDDVFWQSFRVPAGISFKRGCTGEGLHFWIKRLVDLYTFPHGQWEEGDVVDSCYGLCVHVGIVHLEAGVEYRKLWCFYRFRLHDYNICFGGSTWRRKPLQFDYQSSLARWICHYR